MVVGHFATALVAKRLVSRGNLAFYLVISQLPDFVWQVLHFVGLEHTSPANPMDASLATMHAEMTYSHDLLPTLGWIAVAVVAGRAIFGSWRPGWTGGALIVAHALCDIVSGHPHFVFGPDTLQVGFGLYGNAPYVAIAIEVVFTAAVMAWVLHTDKKAGVRQSRTTLIVWGIVFGGGAAMLLPIADVSLIELTGLPAYEALSGTLVPGLVVTYLSMLAALIWVDRIPAERRLPTSG